MSSNRKPLSEDVIKYTCCARDCTGVCIVKVHIRDGVIVSSEPDDTINPSIIREDGHLEESAIERGMINSRPCAKGYAQAEMVYDPARVTYPMKRIGRRGEAKFARISWDEALDTIAQKLVETKQKYGPYSILHMPYSCFGNCSFPLAPWFGAGVAGWDAHSTNGWIEPINWVLGGPATRGALTQDEANIFKSKLIVLWGMNPLVTMNGGAVYNLLRVKEKGIPIIAIEPRYTPSVEVLADQWIPIRPTTDVAMMIAMANVWFKEDLCDMEFIEKYIEPEGLRRWQSYVLGEEDGTDRTPQWAESICGVPEETITEFARLYASSQPVNLIISLSIGRQFYGENGARAAMYLQALTGNVCIPGGTAAAGTNAFGQRAWPTPRVDWQRKPGNYDPPVLIEAFKWPKAIDLREKLDRGEISPEDYNNLIGNAAGNVSPNFQMVILEGNNHPITLPDINATIRAMKRVDFVLVFSQYTEALHARYADILLPQIYTPYEGRNCHCGPGPQEDLFSSGTHLPNFITYPQKCIDPVGEVKPHDWVWTQIAKRLGIVELYNPRMADVPDDKWDETIEELHREAYEKWAQNKEIVPLNPPSWEEFQKKPIFRWELKEIHYPFKEDLEAGENPFRGTDSGKIEFYSSVLAKGPQHLAVNDHPVKGSARCYGPGNLPPKAEMILGGWDTFHSQDTEKYPLLMSSPHPSYRVHSFLDNNLWLRDDCYRHAVWLSAADAKARSIKDDDLVRVYNDIGEMVIPAYVTSRVVPGTVCVLHGSWYQPGEDRSQLMPEGIDQGGAPNFLVHNEDLPETILGMLPCKGLVQVEKWRK